jgi:hypothetical protein
VVVVVPPETESNMEVLAVPSELLGNVVVIVVIIVIVVVVKLPRRSGPAALRMVETAKSDSEPTSETAESVWNPIPSPGKSGIVVVGPLTGRVLTNGRLATPRWRIVSAKITSATIATTQTVEAISVRRARRLRMANWSL